MKTDNNDNELIAEFMDIERHPKESHLFWIPENESWNSSEHLLYDKSWDWLMPVVEKIDSTKTKHGRTDVIIYIKTCHINDPEQIIVEATGNSRLEATYKAVVEFIKWYNDQSK